MNKEELPTSYDPSGIEEKWYLFWEKHGFFKPQASATKAPFCIVLPPPNVTGALHMGHALVNTIQDILIRFMRMKGHKTLWIPGTDHAGIATQTIVERHLFALHGKRRTDFTREEFLEQVWLWKAQYENTILNQLRKLGSSLDWSRLRFTMDDVSTKAVKTMFKKMFDEGLIYRGDYLVNWDPLLQTAIADDEVEHEERDGFLWYFRYPVEDGSHITIATTRPETMLGDVAVAVSPKDDRYKHLVGKQIRLPITNRLIPIITDTYVDPTFGSGAVKITPAHDVNDYEIGIRHNLPMINIMKPDGTINGMPKEKAREYVIHEMRALNLLEKIEPHKLNIGISYRSKAVIEPYLSKQWFVKMGPFKEKLLNAVRSGSVKIVPKDWEKTYFHWIENLRDWCISRQLWWGHQIPVWYKKDDPNQMICQIEGELPNPDLWVQDNDVLDTWFSSALWPMTTLGWPEKTDDFATFYPTSTLITGHDILFFWVARMMLMGEYATGTPPFAETFVHGLIYGKSYWRVNKDGNIAYVSPEERKSYELGAPEPSDVQCKWEKMSKSKGNIIDPIEIIDQYGADAMRFALAASVTHARQIDLDRRRFEEYKNFSNKLWNAARFILSNFDENFVPAKEISQELLTLDDKWIFSRFNVTVKNVTKHLSSYTFNTATQEIYKFFWDEFCAYYLEISKPYLFGKISTPEVRENKQKILLTLFLDSIRLMHPIVPFITEELFSLLKKRFPNFSALTAEACIVAPYPEPLAPQDTNAEEQFTLLNEVVYALRNIRAELQIPLGNTIDLFISGENLDLIHQNLTILHALVRIKNISYSTEHTTHGATALVRGFKLFVPVPAVLQAKVKLRLTKELEKLSTQTASLESQLQNPDFLARAPEALVQKTKDSLSLALQSYTEITLKLRDL